jgi:hypothetical protein
MSNFFDKQLSRNFVCTKLTSSAAATATKKSKIRKNSTFDIVLVAWMFKLVEVVRDNPSTVGKK